MNVTKVLMVLTLCVLLCLMMGLVVGEVHAQKGGAKSSMGGDKDLADKKGMDVIMSSKKKTDPSKMPKKWQKMAGVGSIFVMIAVMKWL